MRPTSEWRSTTDFLLKERFNKEPPTSPIQIRVNGRSLLLPKYNGVKWFFPVQKSHWLERFFINFFTVVDTVQTCSLLMIPLSLLFNYRFWYVFGSIPLTIPVGSYLEDTFGPNYGNFYTAVMALQLSFLTLSQIVDPIESPNRFVVLATFFAMLHGFGIAICWLEKYVLGRTWTAALLAYSQLISWIWTLTFALTQE